MIASLRRRHRVLWVVAGLLLPLLLFLALRARRPELVNEDPYGRGWLMKVRVPRVKSNVSNLLGGSLALEWMEQAARSLRRRMSGELGEVMQDGGLPVVGIAKNLSPEKWDELAREFLLTGESSNS